MNNKTSDKNVANVEDDVKILEELRNWYDVPTEDF